MVFDCKREFSEIKYEVEFHNFMANEVSIQGVFLSLSDSQIPLFSIL